MLVIARLAVLGMAVEIVHAIVPDQGVGVDVVFPDAHFRGVERETETARQDVELMLPVAERADVLLPLAEEEAGKEQRHQHKRRGQSDDQPKDQWIRSRCSPAACWTRRDLPGAARQHDFGDDRLIGEHIGTAEEYGTIGARAVRAAQGNVEGLCWISQAAIGVEAFGVDHGGDDAPEFAPAAAVGKHRKAPDEGAAALHEIDRPCQNQSPGIAGQVGRRALRRVPSVVEPDRLFVAGQGVHQLDLEARRSSEVAQLRSFGEQLAGEPRKTRLAHRRLGDERRHEAAHQLQIAVDVAFKASPQDADLARHLAAQLLILQVAVLPVGEKRRAENDDDHDADDQVRRSQSDIRRIADSNSDGREPLLHRRRPLSDLITGHRGLRLA